MIEILGVKISMLDKPAVRDALRSYLESDHQHYVVTPNPEMVVAANKDEEFREILNGADLAIADGAGLQHAASLNREKWPPRITGNDVMKMLAELCADQNKKIFLLGGEKEDVAKKSSDLLKEEYPTLEIESDPAGPVFIEHGEWHMNPAVLERIKEFEPDCLLVALGHGKQERWIKGFMPYLPSVKVAVGIGGAFDYLAGAVDRAPNWMQEMGLEWTYRMYKEPRRIKRIMNAVIVFPILVIWSKIRPRK
ncbi:MAG: WecB/TagA/CpsF family glycosyltransferase [Candidatus Uhrbacteria bacterium]